MSGDKLLSALKASESEKNFDKTKIANIGEGLKKYNISFPNQK